MTDDGERLLIRSAAPAFTIVHTDAANFDLGLW